MSMLELLQSKNAPESRIQKRIYGVVVGVVKDIKDKKGLARVKVDFNWMGEAEETVSITDEEDRAHSYWARIANFMGGDKRGAYFVPQVDDEVLVAFEHGIIDRPYVLGTLWNKEDVPPEEMDADGKNHIRAIHSRSGHIISFDDNTHDAVAKLSIKSQAGHELLLDDTDDKGKIEIRTNGGHAITLDDAGGTVTVSDSGGNTIVLDANANSLSIQTGANEEHEVGGDLTINVTGSATISASSSVTIDSSDIKLGAAASLTLVNDSFLDIFNSHMHVGNLGAPTAPPLVPAIKNLHSTMSTKGA